MMMNDVVKISKASFMTATHLYNNNNLCFVLFFSIQLIQHSTRFFFHVQTLGIYQSVVSIFEFILNQGHSWH